YNAVGDATGCTEEAFTTETLPTVPTCTSLTSPLNGATNVSIATDLTWNAITDATGYRLTVGTTSGGTDIINNQDVGNVSTFDVPADLPENTQIFVTIVPYNAVGDATGCSEESFTTETITIPLVESKYGFSPNDDGINDFWEIVGIENSPNNTVNIYNRWGDLVFSIANYNNTSNVFRGIANRMSKSGAGKLPDGTYFFDIKISGTHNLKKLKGFVVIKR
ncbi:gliding motility-associated C-terminal domain-containing protein, partial [Seonamhaeicola algicola]